ncbi:uncharacterized protein LOC135708964 [Ochlerotatus camptorhynchus]|uniref:uncharacterized protein LOC135708964 n=1 Tax=Ochlerotatus camptorhynchus TaxID=644619 RepID=UPI0031D7D221
MELWNRRDLVPPVLNTYACKTKNCKDEIRSFITAVTEALGFFESQKSFEKAAAYVSRFSVRWNNRFYNMHGFRLLKRLNQSLLRFRSVDIVHLLTNLASLLPDGNYLEKTAQLPTLANLDYLLVRLQGLGKLFCRIVALAWDAARYYVRFMSTGYFFNISSMFLCLLAEVWFKSKDICQRIVAFYNRLLPFRLFLQNTSEEWPSGIKCIYPEDLGVWLGEEYSEEILAQDDSAAGLNLKPDTSLFLLLTAEKEDLSTTKKVDALIDDKLARPSTEGEIIASIPKVLLMQRIKSDEGERVDRKRSTSAKNATGMPRFNADKIKSKFDVKKFIDDEKLKRRQDLSQAVTQDVNNNAFNAFATSMIRDLNQMSTGDFVKVFKDELKDLLGGRLGKNKPKKNKRFS